MGSGLLQRLVGIRNAPPHIVALTAAASYAAQVFAVLQGWPFWAIVLATLLPWGPLLMRETAWMYKHYGYLALFYLLVITQGGHVIEHVAQILQIHVLGLPLREARGIFGALDVEWVHFVWNTWVLIAVVLLLVRFRTNPWLVATAVIAGWHELEHVFLIATYLTTGQQGTPGLLARGGLIVGGTPLRRPELHMLYNAVETAPLLLAFAYQLRDVYDVWLAKALPHLEEKVLARTTDRCQVVRYAAGQEIVTEGDLPDLFYVISEGEVVVARRDDGREVELRRMGPGEFFGEIGLLSFAPRSATVRAKTNVELLALDRKTFRSIVESSELTAEDLRRIARERLGPTPAEAATGGTRTL